TGGGERQRSLAAYRRAQAKKRAAQMGGVKPQERQTREITLPEEITVQELAQRLAEKGVAVIKTLMGLGITATINETLDQDTAQLVVEEFGHTFKRVSESDVEIGLTGEEDKDEDLVSRAPVVTVMGHVDHGKTSLLDALRKTSVVKGEAGGITQHIGAYQVIDDNGDAITFLDTPGHAAFTQMRARGAAATDIVILVVAADDGVMPQTIEAINHSKAAGVPMIVAINKMDREGANADRVRNELLQYEVVTETFQGDTQEVEVSALTGAGLDKLKEAITLQSEILELKANPKRAGQGVVVEARLDKGRGPVTTVLVQRGTLKIGDVFVAGAEWGKIRALITDTGKQIKEAGPSLPVEVLGANGAPAAGEEFAVVDSEAQARQITEYRKDQIQKRRQEALAAPKTLEDVFDNLKKKGTQLRFDIVLKADVQGSVEAITQSLEKSGNDDIVCRVIHGAVGGITETDIGLASASDALMVGFNTRPSKKAQRAADDDGVAIKYYSIIYNLLDDVKAAMIGELGPEFKENIIGRADIKDAFQAGKSGKAAGCIVIEGSIRNDLKARILRDDVIIYVGQVENLRRFKDDVKKVDSGQECGLTFENYHDFKSGDVLEVYELEEIERTL
ncbi:MAG: translation initiation factor IF-2, partial [Kordiimonadaceae bacterium]|nr:translation initiation factor IF-2 [Kordiimonadaceae bacterium]